MEFVQERITTLHDFGRGSPPAVDPALAETAVVVPMTDRDHASLAAERVFSQLERVDPAVVFVPVRAPAQRIDDFETWLSSFDLSLQVLWCNAPAVERTLESVGLDDGFGKGHDVWLALGPATERASYVVVHDADASSFESDHVRRLLAPLTMEYSFAKGYYARVENDRLYGRLVRLFYEPLVRALEAHHDAAIVSYLCAIRYALAGEFAMTADLARTVRAPRSWGLELGVLGDAFAAAGFDGSAQVDLGHHEHDHRAVAGETGLEGMSRRVGETLFHVLADHGVRPTYDELSQAYLAAGRRLVSQYRTDAQFNGLSYDASAEYAQLERYVTAIEAPGPDRRLPTWETVDLSPDDVLTVATDWT
ncbi:glycosyl transferase family 2 [Halovivax cerinus]|uniref:Glycosyl transferase family 2 n=1 Tax=Halovivax cerinus TaxID=1487865 RepID=A0ABD5NKD3_9EURY|nr:glycosyl transferase family 2 [Halovivax cerinus]